MRTTRRTILSLAALVPFAACGVVTTTTTNGVTTVVINVATVTSYGQAFAGIVKTIEGVPGLSTLLGPYLTPITAIQGVAQTDLEAFNTAAAGKVTLSFDSTSIPAAVSSVLNDGKTLLADLQAAVPQFAGVSAVLEIVNAVETVVSLFEALLPSGFASAAPLKMSEGQALAVLGVKN